MKKGGHPILSLSVNADRPFLQDAEVKQALSDRPCNYIVLSLADNDVIKYRKDDRKKYAQLDLAVEGIRKDLHKEIREMRKFHTQQKSAKILVASMFPRVFNMTVRKNPRFAVRNYDSIAKESGPVGLITFLRGIHDSLPCGPHQGMF